MLCQPTLYINSAWNAFDLCKESCLSSHRHFKKYSASAPIVMSSSGKLNS